MIGRVLRWGAKWLFLTLVVALLAVAIIPYFLDAIYYRGPVSAHFDGTRFKNPDSDVDEAALRQDRSRSSYWRRILNRAERGPQWPEHIAVQHYPIAPRVDGPAMVATWVGHSTFLVQANGLNILTDPIWSERAGPFGVGPGRVAPPGIAFDKLPRIDVVLVSHNHYDHMDLATLKRLWVRDRPLIVTSLGNDSVIGQAGVPSRALDWGGRVAVRPGVEVIVARNHHWSSRWLSDKNRALWSGFVVAMPGGNVFFAGDTGAGDRAWADEAAHYGPVRLALLPIGAFRFRAGQMGNGNHIGPVDAVDIARRLGATRTIGMHWGTFRLSNEGYDTPARLLAAAMRCTGQAGRFDTVTLGKPEPISPYMRPAAVPPVARPALMACLGTPAVRALR